MKEENWESVTKELFGPFTVVTSYGDQQVDQLIETINRFENFLTAGVVKLQISILRRTTL